MITAYIGLGSNLGDRLRNLSHGVEALANIPVTHVERVSRAYESLAAVVEDQPPFLNAVAEVSTGLSADDLLVHLAQAELDLGRVRDIEKGPRVIDLDILLFGEEEWDSETLVIPHPGLVERDFVVTPLLEIAPRVKLPDGTHPRRSRATLGTIVRDLGPVPDAGAGHNMPIGATEWVAVAESGDYVDTVSGFDAGLDFKRQVLEQEGIPFAFEPWAPGGDVDTFGLAMPYRLVVPAAEAGRASALLAEADAAVPMLSDDADDVFPAEEQ